MTRFFFPASRAHHAYSMAIDHGMECATRFGKWPTDGLLYVTGKLYVHLDSWGLLEPRVGDVLYTRMKQGGISIEEITCEERQEKAHHLIARGGRIIQRNGIPFHHPEQEPE
jgi:hypothetical protein